MATRWLAVGARMWLVSRRGDLSEIASAVGRRVPLDRSPKVLESGRVLKLTPAEQDALFAASIITDLTQAPPELLAVARARLQHRIDSSEIHFDVSPGRQTCSSYLARPAR
jgi:hypothetical protein